MSFVINIGKFCLMILYGILKLFPSKENKVLFLSIPYSSGWKARVDGSPVKIQCANIGFMAIPLEAGEHFVELVYITPGMREGIMLSILGIVLFAVLLIGNQKAGAKYEN